MLSILAACLLAVPAPAPKLPQPRDLSGSYIGYNASHEPYTVVVERIDKTTWSIVWINQVQQDVWKGKTRLENGVWIHDYQDALGRTVFTERYEQRDGRWRFTDWTVVLPSSLPPDA